MSFRMKKKKRKNGVKSCKLKPSLMMFRLDISLSEGLRPRIDKFLQLSSVNNITLFWVNREDYLGLLIQSFKKDIFKRNILNLSFFSFTDELGRQQTLSEKKLKKIFDEDTTKVKKLFCFPDD